MLAEIVGEIAAAIVGEAALGWLLPARERSAPPPEGELNASCGSMAAFLAGLGALFCGTACLTMVLSPDLDNPYPLFFAIAFASSALGAALARKTFRVTTRRLALAKAALWVSRVTIVATVIGFAYWLF
jgi:hypothetical protein